MLHVIQLVYNWSTTPKKINIVIMYIFVCAKSNLHLPAYPMQFRGLVTNDRVSQRVTYYVGCHNCNGKEKSRRGRATREQGLPLDVRVLLPSDANLT